MMIMKKISFTCTRKNGKQNYWQGMEAVLYYWMQFIKQQNMNCHCKFFITVKTNIALWLIMLCKLRQFELISEAIQILRNWNLDRKSPCFMTDHSNAEIGANESTFPNCKVFLCDFHREQAWECWIKERKHCLSNEYGSLLLGLLRECMDTPPDFTAHDTDHKYHEAVETLKKSQVWKCNKQVREWVYIPTWLSIPQVWFINNSVK